jgi:hypothetical protein
MEFRTIIAAVLMLAGSTASWAQSGGASIANVLRFHGKVLVNNGQGFLPVRGRVAVKAGDRVFVGKNSRAIVAYNGCDVKIETPGIYTVPHRLPCAQVVGNAGSTSTGGATVPGGTPQLGTVTLIGAVVVGCVLKCDDLLDDDETPTSAF